MGEGSNRNEEGQPGSSSGGPDLRYGFGSWRPQCLQWMNSLPALLTVGSLAICFQFMVVTGLLGVVLTTIERRFGLSSSQSAWISTAYDIGSVVVLLWLSYVGSRLHRPRTMAVGLFLISVGCILMFLPHFLTPEYRPEGGALADSLCRDRSNDTDLCDEESGISESYANYLPMFIVGRVVHGIGATPILILGIGFLDDNTTREKFGFYIGIIYAMGIVGPALGIIGGGLMLTLFTDFASVSDEELGGIDPSDPRWVGAWWLPYMVGMVLCFFIAIPQAGFPVDFPGSAEIRMQKKSEAHKDQNDPKQDVLDRPNAVDYARNCSEVPHHLKKLFTNPTYVMLCLYICCDVLVIAGFATFGPKFVEDQFSLTAAQAGGLFGVTLLPAGAGGSILGGALIRKIHLSCTQIMRAQLVMAILIAAFFFVFFLTCENMDFAGVTVSYNYTGHSDDSYLNLTDSCNLDCACTGISFDPICSHENVRYFTPCHAGCSILEEGDDYTLYYNCSCIPTPGDDVTAWASSETCSARDSCGPSLIIFMVVFFVEVLMVFMCNSMNLSATIRSVPASQRAMAVGIQWILIRLLGSLPGPVAFGVAFDSACILWDEVCPGQRGSCLYYTNWDMSLNLFIVCMSVKAASIIFMFLALALYKPPLAEDDVITHVVGDDTARVPAHAQTAATQDGGERQLENGGVANSDNDTYRHDESKEELDIPMTTADEIEEEMGNWNPAFDIVYSQSTRL